MLPAPEIPTLTLRSSFDGDLGFGAPDGLHLELAEPELSASLGADGWSLRAGFGRIELVIPNDIAGDVLALLLPAEGVRLRGRAMLALDADGARLDGGVGLVARSPEVTRLSALTISDMTSAFEVGPDGIAARIGGTLTLALGPLAITIEGLGASLGIAPGRDGAANLGLLHLRVPTISRPTGFGLRIDAGVVAGGGFLRYDPQRDSYAGAMQLAIALGPVEIAVSAFGMFGTIDGDLSFVVVMAIEFAPPIELFLGLTLNGVGGVFGWNRSLDHQALAGLIRAGRADDLLFPADVIGRAPQIIAATQQVFPAKLDQTVVGPLLKLGWGRPVSFVTLTVGVVTTFPSPTMVAIIGRLAIALPDPNLAIIDLRADFLGVIDFDTGNVSFDASLNNSRLGMFSVGGDLALRAGPQGFVFSAGGFHPRFQPPTSIATMRRLSVDLSPGALVEISAEAYVAITASTFQLGARAFVKAELGPFGARGNIGFDVIIYTEPRFRFSAEITGEFALTLFGEDLMSAKLELLLEGPGLWHAVGQGVDQDPVRPHLGHLGHHLG